MKKISVGLALVFAVLLVYVAINIINTAGLFTDIEAISANACQRVDVFPGTEDVTIDPDTGIVFVSADDRRANATEGGRRIPGGIYAFHIDRPETVTKVSNDAPADFHPHGISLWAGTSAEGADLKRLMVINHAGSGDQIVEIFNVGASGELTHVKSITFEQMHSPNDVVAVGPSAFYASNDRGYHTGLMAQLETYLSLPLSSAVYYDGDQGNIAVEGLKFANGINVSHDGETVYIAEVMRQSIGVYQRDVASGTLTHIKSISLGTGPDNIEIAEDGMLWVASHPRLFDFLAHAADENVNAPTQIQTINPLTDEVTDQIVLLDGEINAASVGAVYGDRVVIGAVFDGHVLVCKAPLEQD